MKKPRSKLTQALVNNFWLKVLSVLIAVAAWLAIDEALKPDTTSEIENVPVTIDTTSGVLKNLGLNPIEGADTTVEVVVRGERYVVAGLTSKDVEVVASLSNVTGAGRYDLSLTARNKSNKDFEIVAVDPATIRVRFDKLVEKTFPVEVDISGLSVPSDYMLAERVVEPNEITVRGPEAEIAKIDRCVVPLSFDGEISKNTTVTETIQLLDKEGTPILSDELSYDKREASVTLKVLKSKELPLTIEFLNVPAGFPIEELEYSLSNETLTVAGPPDIVDGMTSYNIGYVDLRTLGTEGEYQFDVVLPTDFINIDKVETVAVSFDMSEFTTRTFNVTNIRIVNSPVGYTVTPVTKQISSVVMVGRPEVLETLSSGDIVAEIDMSSRDISTGQLKVVANIIAPTKGLVWAYGDYNAVVSVQEK